MATELYLTNIQLKYCHGYHCEWLRWEVLLHETYIEWRTSDMPNFPGAWIARKSMLSSLLINNDFLTWFWLAGGSVASESEARFVNADQLTWILTWKCLRNIGAQDLSLIETVYRHHPGENMYHTNVNVSVSREKARLRERQRQKQRAAPL